MKLHDTISMASLVLLAALPEISGFRSLLRRLRPQSPATTAGRNEVHVVDNVALMEPAAATPVTSRGGLDMNILPDLDDLFGQIQKVSPLAKWAIENEQKNFGPAFDVEPTASYHHGAGYTGFETLSSSAREQKWKTIETNRRGPVTRIDRIDNFNGIEAPLLRFRGTLEGPCEADLMASLIMDLEERSKWDIQIDDVYEAHSFHDLAAANAAMGFEYGDCYRLGVGYCRTKKNLGIDSREQLTVCGINKFSDGASMIWGVEMDERHDDFMPSKYSRVTRAKSHLFSTTLVPTGDSSFDFEYTLQLEIGGKIPTFFTTPIVTDSVKRMFKCAKEVYAMCEKQRSSETQVEKTLLLSP